MAAFASLPLVDQAPISSSDRAHPRHQPVWGSILQICVHGDSII